MFPRDDYACIGDCFAVISTCFLVKKFVLDAKHFKYNFIFYEGKKNLFYLTKYILLVYLYRRKSKLGFGLPQSYTILIALTQQ